MSDADLTEEYPTQRTRFWLEFFKPVALIINAGIVAMILVTKAPSVYRWAAVAVAAVSLSAGLWKGWQFKRRYSL